jgi:hypothetical protein
MGLGTARLTWSQVEVNGKNGGQAEPPPFFSPSSRNWLVVLREDHRRSVCGPVLQESRARLVARQGMVRRYGDLL